ncbi:DUF4190 domain-containing protein [Pseudarthrobacter raffinosi]|uniref:DUF4190 domain-containing protein n=1 Tax=Pseudarthrobacter raffinosi TaxID=2953651 RepID=UPI00208EF58C|nr:MULTISPECIES: DUF4190 domain-containing protein [unclassified Pseudarthrobacter]MCO4252536.1 DUF4190 domain-containing protein [Pseudarthrobacter sp. MDT3-9]MCO4263891.1 DUF4190 domain-containing protein [Pseudarthrobacter sp. MDT3-26]
MTDQPTPRPDSQGSGAGPGDSPAGYEPPQFVPPQGPSIPAPPPYDQNPYGQNQFGQDQYSQSGQYNQPGAYSQPGDPYGATYGQPASPYGQGASPYGQPASPYGQPAYGQPAYYGMPAQQPKGLSIASMVLGISSVILGWFMIPQIAAIITGHLALRREPSGKGMSITGLVLGYLCLLGYGAFWLFVIIGLAMYRSSGYSY